MNWLRQGMHSRLIGCFFTRTKPQICIAIKIFADTMQGPFYTITIRLMWVNNILETKRRFNFSIYLQDRHYYVTPYQAIPMAMVLNASCYN